MPQHDAVLSPELPEHLTGELGLFSEGDWRLTDTNRPLSVAEQIAERISSDILRGVYKPGERIIEQSIADGFQVSRGPVRDAIRILEREGVVEILPRRGAQVTALTVEEVDDIFAIRGTLIALGIKLATPLLTDQELAQVSQWVDKLSAAVVEGGSTQDYVPISYHISLFISRRCNNERLFEMIRSMSRQTLRYSHLSLSSAERRVRSAGLWRELATALESRDAEAAADIASRLIGESGMAARQNLSADKID